jgi:hypothetical protein
MNIAALILLVAFGWSALSIIVALTFGGMAKTRDVVLEPALEGTGQVVATYDEGLRTAV